MVTPVVFYPEKEKIFEAFGIERDRASELLRHVERTLTNKVMDAKSTCRSNLGEPCTCSKISISDLIEQCCKICTNVNEVAYTVFFLTQKMEATLNPNPLAAIISSFMK